MPPRKRQLDDKCMSSSSEEDSSEEEELRAIQKRKKRKRRRRCIKVDTSDEESSEEEEEEDESTEEEMIRQKRKKRKKRRHRCPKAEEASDDSESDGEADDGTRYVLAKRSKRRKRPPAPGGLNIQKLFMAAIIAKANQSMKSSNNEKRRRAQKMKARDEEDSGDSSDMISGESGGEGELGEGDEDYVPVNGKPKKQQVKNSTRTVQRRLARALLPLRGGVLPDEEEDYIRTLTSAQAKALTKQAKIVTSRAKRSIPLAFRVLKWPCTAQTKAMICERITQVEEMEPGEGEYAKLSTWLMNVDALPIGKHTTIPVNIERDPPAKVTEFLTGAQETLDRAVHGHAVAKKEIVRLCAQWISNPNAPTQALAIQGPMGNGKTTLVKRGIAKVMNRPFVFIALGGAQDASFLSGHDYTYEGARPGRIATAIKSAGCMDPVIFLDELDKLSDTAQGREIQHTLLHLLDTSQNSHFRDKYFDGIDLDMSRALFVVSFNDPSKIDRILLDRMRVVVTHGFGVQDKLQIAKEFMIPNIISDFNLSIDDIEITDDAVRSVIQNFTEEKGVRCLRRCIHQICAEANLQRLLNLDQAKKKTVVDVASVGAYVKSLRPQGKNLSSLAMYS